MPPHRVSTPTHQLHIFRPLTRRLGALESNIGTPNTMAEGACLRDAHELDDTIGRVLPIGIHRQGVGEAARRRLAQPVQHGGSFASVLAQYEHSQARLLDCHRRQAFGGIVGAAVDDDPNRRPLRERGAYRRVDLGPRVVAWESERGGWSTRHASVGDLNDRRGPADHPSKGETRAPVIFLPHQRAVLEHRAGKIVVSHERAEPIMGKALRYVGDELCAGIPAWRLIRRARGGRVLRLVPNKNSRCSAGWRTAARRRAPPSNPRIPTDLPPSI